MIGADAAEDLNIVGSKTRQWGLAAVQGVDAAAMSLWVQWDEEHASVSCGAFQAGLTEANGCALNENLGQGFNNLNIVKGGALINF